MSPVSLGIDVGTGSTKAGLVDEAGRLVRVARAAHRIDTPQVGLAETDPHAWLDSSARAVAAVLDGQAEVPVAIGLSGQMHGVVLTRRSGDPVRPAVLWPDQRARIHLPALRTRLGAGADRLANPLTPGMAGPIMFALRVDEPRSLAATRWALQPKDWLRLQLTGTVATDPSDASATLLWEPGADDWCAAALAAFEVDRDLLAPVHASDEVAGTLQAAAASRLGLPAGLTVAVGAADTAAALHGAGLAPGETQVSVGTGGQVACILEAPIPDPSGRTHLYRAATDGVWYAMGAIQNAGLAIDLAWRLLGIDPEEAATVAAASRAGAGGVTFLPYVSGERTPHLDPDLRGAWQGIGVDTTRHDLVRAVFEGVAFALRDGLDALRAVGHGIDHALLAGGGSREPWWRQLLADALGVPLVVHDASDASVRGAGLLAWAAIGERPEPAMHVHREEPVLPRDDVLADALARFRAATPTGWRC